MAKGQKKGNREVRKQKADKPAAPVLSTMAKAGSSMLTNINSPKKKT